MIARSPFVTLILALVTLPAAPALAQGWDMVDTGGLGGAGAYVCPVEDAETGNSVCFQLGCTDADPLGFEIDIVGGDAPGQLAVMVNVDDRAAGQLSFTRHDGEDYIKLTAPFDPRLHRDLVAKLRAGIRADLEFGYPDGAQSIEMSLRGSSRTLGAVLDTCPMPEVPLDDPAAVVLDEIVTECAALGGTIAMEPGFERREDLDGDGREDVVIDYAAAVCSEMASLYCGSGGCTVGFFLARGDAYRRLYDGVIRGYTALPGGRLALDLHGTACGLYGFEACRKVFDITGDSFTLVQELAGEEAEAAMAADAAITTEPEDADDEAATAVEEDAVADGDADDATATAVEEETSGREWVGDGESVVLPDEGEALPEDLAPAPVGTAPAENPDDSR